MKRKLAFTTHYKYERIQRRTAQRLYESGCMIYVVGINQRIEHGIQIDKELFCGGADFNTVINSWEFYNKPYYGYPTFYLEYPRFDSMNDIIHN